MNGNCYYSEGINPAVTCNKNEGNRIAIPIDVNQDKKVAIGIDDTYRGRDPYIYEQYAPTLRSERFGFKVGFEVKPVEMSGNKLSESDDQCHTLNANDQRKIFGANQKRTMVGNMFVVDKGTKSKERDVANCIESREDRGLSARQQEGTLVCHQITNTVI